ncbi:MAG: ATP-binding protein [Bacilli bacterium]|nr:ATP-binding protein [Bacilli bacterium]
MYINRALEREVISASKEFACITIYGARQTGKSTMIRHIFNNDVKYITLDDLSIRDYAIKDPKGFLKFYGYPLVIDEIQKVPSLLNYIKIVIDEKKNEWLEKNEPTNILYILTGSNQFELQEAISESLAGRTAVFNMGSLSFAEIFEYENISVFNPDIEILKEKENKKHIYRSRKEIFEDIFKGGMPEYIANNINRDRFFNSYVTTYIEKDVKKVISSTKETTFLTFMEYIALRTANQIDYNEISRSVGIDARTVKEWLSILETSGIIKILHPYLSNVSDRIIKTPKLYFLDTGLCSYLAHIPSAQILEKSAFAGAFYETYVVSEIIKSYYSCSKDYKKEVYYYRDRDQKEVDLIIESFEGIYPIEIKKGIYNVSHKKDFDFLKKYKKNILHGLIIDSCEEIRPLNDKIYYCPISLIGL